MERSKTEKTGEKKSNLFQRMSLSRDKENTNKIYIIFVFAKIGLNTLITI